MSVCDSTVRKRLLENGRKARKPIKKQLLTDGMKKQRLDWAKQHRNWTAEDWSKVLFCDESHFEVHGRRSQYVRRSKGEPVRPGRIKQRLNLVTKKMFWGSIYARGLGRLRPCEGMMK